MSDTINLKRKDIFTLFLSSLCSFDLNDNKEHADHPSTDRSVAELINKANKNTK